MRVRLLEFGDLPKLKEIHKKHYQEFENPLERQLLEKIVIETDEGEIITFGALEQSVEVIAMTNKSLPVEVRREALLKLYHALCYNAAMNGFDMIHCTVTDKNWERHLKKYGFVDSVGKWLIRKV